MIRQWVNVILGFVAILTIFFIFVGIPISIMYLNKKILSNDQYDNRSGKGRGSEIPNEIRGWNWGAAFLSWVWGACNSVWLSFLIFIPIINLFWWIVLGIKGNQWAWQNNKWKSIEKFKKSQEKWKIWGIIFFSLDLVMAIIILFNKISS